jgi:multidrug efflux pump subunit AcrB
MWLIKASLRNPHMVACIVLMMVVLGGMSIWFIPKDILPVFKAPAVEVLTYYQGMPAASVEKTITNRIERWVNQAPGAMRIESKSGPGVSIVKIYFREDVDPNGALTVTNSLALGALPTLPPNTLPPVVLPFDPTGTLPLGILTVNNPELSEARLKDVARIDVRNMLGEVKGCVAPVVIGGKDRTVVIYLRPNDLEARHLSPLDVVEALKNGNLMVTPGIAYFGDTQVLLDTNVMVDQVEELNDLPIRIKPGANVYLRDIGEARDSNAIQTSRVRINGKNQVYVPVYRQQGASSLAVADGVKAHIPIMEERLKGTVLNEQGQPTTTKLAFVMDQSLYVREAINSLIEEGVIGAVLVTIMILVFLGNWRMTLIASLSIPLAILGAITCLYVTGNTINVMTLGGLALAIGPLVDDAIVELENNHRNYHLGKSRIRAALDGCAEVMVPVLVATCTTNIVLAPLAFMPGMGGFLFRPLALAVTFAMFSSFLLSRTFVPMMCAKFLPDENRGKKAVAHGPVADDVMLHVDDMPISWFGRLHQKFDAYLTRANKNYERTLNWCIDHPKRVLFFTAALFVGSCCLLPFIGREFFPQVDAGQITMFLRVPSNLRLDKTTDRVAQVEEFINSVIPREEREMIVSEIGLDPDWSAAYTANSGQQDAVIRIQLHEDRRLSAQQYAIVLRHLMSQAFAQDYQADPDRALKQLAAWSSKNYAATIQGVLNNDPKFLQRNADRFADLRLSFDTGGMVSTALNYGASSPIDIQIEGGQRKQHAALAAEIRKRVTGVPGSADVRVLQRTDAPYIVLKVDRKKAADFGLSARDVIQQAVVAINGSTSINENFWIDARSGNQYFVSVMYPEDPHRRLEDVLNTFATGTNQANTVKLSALVEPVRREDAVEINHVSLYPVTNILVNTENRDIGGVAGDINRRLEGLQIPQGIRVQLKGEYARMNESFRNLMAGLAFAAVLVYLLQVALFRSWVGPFIIMFVVPLGMIGVFIMLFLTGTTLNVQSQMGMIFLVGIEVTTGVLMIEFANKQRQQGLSVRAAIVSAATIRFRPILMTFFAAFFDLLPMAIGMGHGSEANVPLARAVVGGLLASTLLGRFVLPVLYTLLIKEGSGISADIEAELADEPPAPARLALAAAGAEAAHLDGVGLADHVQRKNGDEHQAHGS